MISGMSATPPPDGAHAALWTLGVTAYAAVILVCIGIGVNAAARHRRRTMITMAVVVVLLSIAGIVAAVLSSTH